MTTSLVTGAAGFIGSTLAETLVVSGDTVVGIDSFLDYYDRSLKEKNLEKLRERFSSARAAVQRRRLLQWPGMLAALLEVVAGERPELLQCWSRSYQNSIGW